MAMYKAGSMALSMTAFRHADIVNAAQAA